MDLLTHKTWNISLIVACQCNEDYPPFVLERTMYHCSLDIQVYYSALYDTHQSEYFAVSRDLAQGLPAA